MSKLWCENDERRFLSPPDVNDEERTVIRNAGQIKDDLIPICRQNGGVEIGDTGCQICDVRYAI